MTETAQGTRPPQTFLVTILTVSFVDACPYELLMFRQKVLTILCDSFIKFFLATTVGITEEETRENGKQITLVVEV